MKNIKYTYEVPSYPMWCELRNIAGWETYNKSTYKKVVANTLCFVLAKHNGKIIGMGRLLGDNVTSFYIQGIVVKKQYQHQGIGTGIVTELLNYAKQNTLEFSSVHLFAHKGTELFYKKCGFIQQPNDTKGAGMAFFIHS